PDDAHFDIARDNPEFPLFAVRDIAPQLAPRQLQRDRRRRVAAAYLNLTLRAQLHGRAITERDRKLIALGLELGIGQYGVLASAEGRASRRRHFEPKKSDRYGASQRGAQHCPAPSAARARFETLR